MAKMGSTDITYTERVVKEFYGSLRGAVKDLIYLSSSMSLEIDRGMKTITLRLISGDQVTLHGNDHMIDIVLEEWSKRQR